MAIDFDKLMGSVKQTFKNETSERKDFAPDPRFIKVTKDEAGNGQIVVRIIPDKNGLGVVKLFKHFGKIEDPKTGNKRWFIANCPTTLDGGKCPYCEAYLEAWKNKDEAEIAKLKQGKRNESYISNVLIIKDPGNPSNNGKVMLLDYGYKISKMIEESLNGDPDSEIESINIYHPLNGANLLIRHSKQGQQYVLDGTKFLTPSSICEDMEAFESILEKTYDLTEFIANDKFESYDELNKKFFKFIHGFDMGGTASAATNTPKPTPKATQTTQDDEAPWEEPAPKPSAKPSAKPTPKDDDDFFNDL